MKSLRVYSYDGRSVVLNGRIVMTMKTAAAAKSMAYRLTVLAGK